VANRYTIQEAVAMRQAARTAYTEALSSKSYGIGSRNTTRQDLGTLLNQMNFWDSYVAMLMGEGTQMIAKDLVSVDPAFARTRRYDDCGKPFPCN
jgi:hypothetical protein